jgi:flagellar hook-basal body complex protein FliE
MDGFTISSSNKWLEAGGTRDSKSISINDSSLPSSGGATGVGSTDSSQKSFSDTLRDAIGSVNALHKASDKATQELATGKTDNVADVMIASEKADIALRLMVQVRNKIIDAYQEVMKMQV